MKNPPVTVTNPKGRGRKTALDDALLLKIREWVIEGKTEKEMAKLSGVGMNTFDSWKYRNYQGFADKMLEFKHEAMLQQAEMNIKKDLLIDDSKADKDVRLMKIRHDSSWKVAETLGKKSYSKQETVEASKSGLVLIENMLVNISNGESDRQSSADSIQGPGNGRTIEVEANPVGDLRADIQALLTTDEPDGSHEVRKELGSGTSSAD